jgi:hypothetical protein
VTDTTERELGWEDEIENDGEGFTDLPDGDYNFTVTDFERERHAGSAKLPPCNKAVVHLKIDGGELGTPTIKHNLFLHTKTEGLLCSFFTGIGQRQHGEKLKMDWSRVKGATGRLKLGHRTFHGDDGPVTVLDVKKIYEPKDDAAPAASYTKGAF